MDVIGGINQFREDQYNTVVGHRGDVLDPNNLPGAPGIGKPKEYGMGGRPSPVTPRAGMRLAGTGLTEAAISALSPHVIEPLRKHVLQPAFNFAIGETFGMTPRPVIAGR